MIRAEVVRGVYVRGKPYPEGAIVELSVQEFAELRGANYVVRARDPVAVEPRETQEKTAKR